ncbi:MAG TPA: thiamine phosphate synthase [Bacteroidales bacterium]|nr:thiamine phosphate synthase [Bacteroidales bacterium]HQH19075.1 thiamine phosphate synthase [Bacteroidales bacterium]HQI46233.1 thiamine phosphate synthase [Bacteroidales bacterium]
MFKLCLVTDEKLCMGRSLPDIVRKAVEGGVTMVQLREKNADTRTFIEKAFILKEILNPFRVPLIINDRVDVALAVKADGIHIGQKDMPYELLKKIIPESMIVGLSVETMEQIQIANNYKVDYLGISPIFATPTKTDTLGCWGIEGLKKARNITNHKLIAIGGISKTNVKTIIDAGANGIAVVSAICSAEDPQKAASELLSLINIKFKF